MEQHNRVSSLWMVYLAAAIIAGGLTAFGVWLAVDRGVWSVMAAGAAGLLGVLVTWPLASVMARSAESRDRSLEAAMTPVYERFEQLSVMLNEMSEQQLISERAKQVAYRSKDLEALRRAITEDILKRDWDPALALVDAMANDFGYRAEAENLRQEISAKRNEAFRRTLNESAAVIERYSSMEQWAAAFKEAERVAQLYPENEQIRNLPLEIEARRQAFKKKLVDEWYAAVNRRDVDGAIDLLKKLDTYLSPLEAESLQETARTLFKEKIALLRTQFTLAVQEKNWSEAVRVGEAIMRDFPNTQMAKEVHDKIAVLRERSQSAEPVAV